MKMCICSNIEIYRGQTALVQEIDETLSSLRSDLVNQQAVEKLSLQEQRLFHIAITLALTPEEISKEEYQVMQHRVRKLEPIVAKLNGDLPSEIGRRQRLSEWWDIDSAWRAYILRTKEPITAENIASQTLLYVESRNQASVQSVATCVKEWLEKIPKNLASAEIAEAPPFKLFEKEFLALQKACQAILSKTASSTVQKPPAKGQSYQTQTLKEALTSFESACHDLVTQMRANKEDADHAAMMIDDVRAEQIEILRTVKHLIPIDELQRIDEALRIIGNPVTVS
jgi:hypothetical protein